VTVTLTWTWDSPKESTLNAGASGGTGTGAGAGAGAGDGAKQEERCKLKEYLATAPIFHHRCHILTLPSLLANRKSPLAYEVISSSFSITEPANSAPPPYEYFSIY